jgi:hypothetical protein
MAVSLAEQHVRTVVALAIMDAAWCNYCADDRGADCMLYSRTQGHAHRSYADPTNRIKLLSN